MDLKSKFRWDQATPVRIAGALVVILSMFFKAFRGDAPLHGYQCAYMTLEMCLHAVRELVPRHTANYGYAQQMSDLAFGAFVGASGLINPLLLLYLLFKPIRRTPVLVLFGVLLVEAICVLVIFRIPPNIGFFLWVAGIILILAPPYKSEKQASARFLIPTGFGEPARRA